MALEDEFPNLRSLPYSIQSPRTRQYNCFAWAAGRNDIRWEPDRMQQFYWPPQAPRSFSIQAFVEAYRTLGFAPCDDTSFEPGFEKIAFYATPDLRVKHAARQLSNGLWTSKLGDIEDIEHLLDGLSGAQYGAVVQILKRPCT